MAAINYLEDTGTTLELYDDDEACSYSVALEISNPQEIRRVALSLIEERANA